MNLQARIFNVGQIRKIRDARQSQQVIEPLYDSIKFITTDKELMNEYYNKMVNYRYACVNQAFLHQVLINKAVSLMTFIENEYN